MEDNAIPPVQPIAAAATIQENINCVQCSYNLRSLSEAGNCPECGTPVWRSMRGFMLRYSSPEYLAKLHRGVFLILAAICAQIILTVATALIAAGVGARGGDITWLIHAMTLLGLGVAAALLYGWWLFSEPDPAFVGQNNGSTARQVVRISIAASAAITLIRTPFDLLPQAAGAPPVVIVFALAGILGLVANVVQFFASMLYVRWLAPRIPNERVAKRAKMLMWLGPVLMTVGAFILIGPLIALVLYWNMLNWVRRDIKAIREAQTQEFGAANIPAA